MSSWLSELLDALERHTQALQANTAAVHSFLEQSRSRGILPGPGSVQLQLLEQLELAHSIAARLEAMRRELLPLVSEGSPHEPPT